MANEPTTLDIIDVALLRMGYGAREVGLTRTPPLAFAVYRRADGDVVVSWNQWVPVYEVAAPNAVAATAIGDALVEKDLTCRLNGRSISVYGQEHVDAEVRRLLST